MEVAGLALNILPLMVSAAENYKRLFLTPLSRYRDFSKEADRYIVRLENQRAIFQTQCVLLLSTVVDTPAACQILGALHEQAPATKAEVEERLQSLLGSSRAALIRTIQAIDSALLATQRECNELSETVKKDDQGKENRNVGNVKLFSSWKNHIRQKLKFCFSESRLSANLKILSDLNQDFVTLSSFFQRQSNAGEKKPTHSIAEKIIDKHRVVSIAAEEIWRFLIRLECDGCEENYALLGIGDKSFKQDRAESDLTEFDLALRCIRTSPDLSKFLVTTKLQAQDSSHKVVHVEELQAMLQSVLKIEQSPSEMLEQGMGDCVTTQARNSAPCDGPSSARKHSRQDGERKASDLCGFLNHPAFDRVSGSIQAFSACDGGAKASKSKGVCERAPGTLKSTTLHELLQTCSHSRPRDGLPVPERLRLAKILSVAYFRFHSTGWADSGWNSKCISFPRTEKDLIISDVTSLHMPYLQSRVYSTSSVRTSSFRTSSVSQSPPTFGPSSASIFNLGVLLLEIGYSMNWDTLYKARPAHYSKDDLLSAALQARTLQANGLFDMGGTYRKIVSKLIECAFGNVYDLDDPKQEAAFLDAVIKPLEEEERNLRTFLNASKFP